MLLTLRSTFAISGLLSVLADCNDALACPVSAPSLLVDFEAGAEPDLRPDVRDSLQAIYDATLDGAADETQAIGDRLFERPLSDYEAAHTYQAAGHVFAEQWELPEAMAAFENSLGLGMLSDRDTRNLHYNLGKLKLYLEQPEGALDAFQTWFDSLERPASHDYQTILSALGMAGRPEDALRWAELAIEDLPEDSDEWQRERFWLQLELGRIQDIDQEVKAMAATSSGEAAFLIRMASVYTEGGSDEGLVPLLEWGWLQNLLGPDQQLHLARLYLSGGDPYKAAALLERGLYDRVIAGDASHWLLLAESWLAAQDVSRALEPLRNAAEQSDDAALYQRLARLHLDLREWPAAEHALRKALTLGSGEARLLLFAALFLQARFEEAGALLAAPPPPAPGPIDADSGAAPAVPCLGIRTAEVEADTSGAWIAAVQPDTPAESAGLETGDRIVQYGSRQVETSQALLSEIRSGRPGEGFGLVVLRSERYVALHGSLGGRADPDGVCRSGR